MSLEQDLRRFRMSASGDMRKLAQRAVLDLSQRIISASPVDTGGFRNNWQSSIEAINYSYDLGSISVSGADSHGRLQSTLPDLRIGMVFYFTNNMPYAQRLEDGYSAQAEHGMVKINAREWDSIVRKQIAILS